MLTSKLYPEHIKPLESTRSNGFTLVELLVVLAIMSLAAVLFIGASGGSGSTIKKSEIAKLKREITGARQRALQTSKRQMVNLEKSKLTLKPYLGNARNLIFYRDGSTNGGIVTSEAKQILVVRWIDGTIVK